jgi:hypothetical protein
MMVPDGNDGGLRRGSSKGQRREPSMDLDRLHKLMRACAACAIAGLLACAGPAAAQEAQVPAEELERDLTVAQKPIFELFQSQAQLHVGIDAWVDKANVTYAIGQALRVMVRPHEDCYVTVVDVGSSGRVSILYPNHFQLGTRVRAGSTLAIPASSARWQIKVGGPVGVDLIQVFAARHPLTLPELKQLVHTTAASPIITLSRSAEDVARDLIPQLKPPPSAGTRPPPGVGVRNLLVRIVAEAALGPNPAAVFSLNRQD